MKISKGRLRNIINTFLFESRFENMTQLEFFNVNQDELTPEEQIEFLEALRQRTKSDPEPEESEIQISDDFIDDKLPNLNTRVTRRELIKGGVRIAAAIAAGSSFFSSLFKTTLSGGISTEAGAEKYSRYHNAQDLINILTAKGYRFASEAIIPLKEEVEFNNDQGLSEEENMNQLFKYLAYWLSYYMPQLGIATLEDMISRNIAYTSEGADEFVFGEFKKHFKKDNKASEFLGLRQSRGQFSSPEDMTLQALIPAKDAIEVLGFHPDSVQDAIMDNEQDAIMDNRKVSLFSLFDEVAVGTLEGIPVVVITNDAYDHIIFLK